VLFDGGALPIEENVTETKRIVEYVRSVKPDIIVEGELGYIGKSSVVHRSLPDDVSVDENSFTTPEAAQQFVRATGIDLLAPAVGNIHGMLAGAANPRLDTERIRAIQETVETPLVLHGGSGVDPRDSAAAIAAGVAIIHVNTELRVAWRRGIERMLGEQPDEVRPYRLLEASRSGVTDVVRRLLREWNRL
jgi:fructose-bisphosphate aldolase class II